MLWDDIILLFILLIISSFFSGAEIAFVVSNKLKIEVKARKNNIPAKNAFYFIKKPHDFFSTILIGNNIVNIAFASMSTVVLTTFFGFSDINILFISTFLLLIFGEIIPKYISRELADRVLLVSSLPLRLLSFVLFPFVKIMSSISSILSKSSSVKEETINYLFSKQDIEMLVEESSKAGVVDKKDSDLINKVFALGDQRVYEAMRPRTEIVGVEIGQSIDEVISVFIDSGYSKLPVYEENLDNIKGVVLAHDVFKFPKDLKSIMREVIFVPDTKKSFDMLNEFLAKHVSFAIVIDEFGGTAGIITMEDIMEELFGEIKDEYDVDEDICRRIAKDTYLISGKVEIDFINEKYNLEIPTGDYKTIGGYITSNIGKIPFEGETIRIDKYNFLIVRASASKIDLVKLTILEAL
jgi:CBS domain containing-hemolysin-like protein